MISEDLARWWRGARAKADFTDTVRLVFEREAQHQGVSRKSQEGDSQSIHIDISIN